MEYPAQLKETVVRKALAREMTQVELARTYGVSKSSVQQWLRAARQRGDSAVANNEDRRARDWGAEERFAALVETHGMSEEALGVWCRGHGVYAHELAQWRRDALAGTAPVAASSESRTEAKRLRQEVSALRRELNRKDKALAETAALLVLEKKVGLLLGEDEER